PNDPRRDRWMISLGPKSWWSARRRVAILAAAALAAAMVPVLPGLAWAEEQVPFAITIRHISCVDACDEEGLEALLESTPDFYVKVFINGVKQPPGSDPDDPSSPRIE